MYVSVDTILTASSLLGAIGAFVTLFWKLFKWINHQKEQDQTIAEMKAHYDKEIEELRSKHETDIKDIQKEQTVIIYGLLACLKGLQEQGCNGAVTEAIDKIEKHINQKAHGQLGGN